MTVEPLQALPFKKPSLPSILRTFPFLSVLPSNHYPFRVYVSPSWGEEFRS
jgi:hypothetical protein